MVDHGNFGELDVVWTPSSVHMAPTAMLTLNAMYRGIKYKIPGLTSAEVASVSNVLYGLQDGTEDGDSFAGMWLRLLCVLEGVCHGAAFVPAVNPQRCWPDDSNRWPNYNDLLADLMRMGDPNFPVLLLDVTKAGSPITPAILNIFWLASQNHCGLAPALGPNSPFVGGRIEGSIRTFFVGKLSKPNMPPTAWPAPTICDVWTAIRLFGQITGEMRGAESAWMMMARRVHFVSPFVSNLSTQCIDRFHGVGAHTTLMRIWHLCLKVGAGNTFNAAQLNALKALFQALGLGPALANVNTVSRNLPNISQELLDLANAYADCGDFETFLSADQQLKLLNELALWDPYTALGVPRPNYVAPGPVTWNSIYSEDSYTADGLYGRFTLPTKTGITRLMRDMSSTVGAASGELHTSNFFRKFITGTTASTFLSQLYITATFARCAADVSVRTLGYSQMAIDARVGLLDTGNNTFDAWYSEFFTGDGIAGASRHQLNMAHVAGVCQLIGGTDLEWRDTSMSGLTLSHPSARNPRSLIPAAFHPSMAEVVFGTAGHTGGGLFSPETTSLRSLAASSISGLMGVAYKGICPEDRVSLVDFVGWLMNYRVEWVRRVSAYDSNAQQYHSSSLPVGAAHNVHQSGNFPQHKCAAACRSWWYADGLNAVWEVHRVQEVPFVIPLNDCLGRGTMWDTNHPTQHGGCITLTLPNRG